MLYPVFRLFGLLHGKGDAVAFGISRQDDHIHDITDGDRFGGVLDITAADLRDMHQTVLMDADIHERAEIRHIAYRSFELHTRLQVLEIEDIRAEQRRRQLIAWIAPGLLKLGNNIHQGRHTNPAALCGIGSAQFLYACRKLSQLAGSSVLNGVSAQGKQRFSRGVGFGMDRGPVEQVVTFRYAQKARTLLISLGAKPFYLCLLYTSRCV